MKARQGRRCSLSRSLSVLLAKTQEATQGGPGSRGHTFTLQKLQDGHDELKSLRIHFDKL